MSLWIKSNTFDDNTKNLKKSAMAILTNFYVIIGLSLMLLGIVMLIFPPKFGSTLYGVRTKITMKNSTTWIRGQKLFACSILAFGVIFSIFSVIRIEGIIKPLPMVIFFKIGRAHV